MKAALRERVLANHEKATDLLVEAVTKSGMTLQQVKSTSSFRAVPFEREGGFPFADTVGPGRRERIQKTMPHHNNALRAQQR